MHLYLSPNSPWSATYSNTEGQIIYKAISPRYFGIGPLSVTIERAVPSNVAKTETKQTTDFCSLAEIDFPANPLTASRIRYNSIDMSTNDFFRKTGIFWMDRVFKGPDDKEYEWDVGTLGCKLYLKNPSKPLVATYHHRKRKLWFIGGETRPASIEILPEGQHIVDLIIVTFIYVEKLRDQRKKHY